ncbi:MAG TPA: tyrosine/phenylalanine carboxypeptidase domain-containing protein [Sphingomicrobium sp.]|nr:tyrosine/phenylalanine carboxypeptidase domain-containing protein [Sphingomicrobium sp.]
MSVRARLEVAENSNELRFGPRGELRETFGTSGRVHLDRWLPFLVLHRSEDPDDSIGRRVATNSPAYLIWSPDDDVEARSALDILVARLRAELGPILLIHVEDAPTEPAKEDSPQLPDLEIQVRASGTKGRAAAEAFAKSARTICVDLRSAEVTLKPPAAAPVAVGDGADSLSVSLPQIHLMPGGGVYPQLTHDLAAALIDALLCAAADFIGQTSADPPPHFRSLGRSAFLAAALHADKKLDTIAGSFDFLLSISPINVAEAMARFLDEGGERTPDFRYRPLTVDPDTLKRDLYAIDLSHLEDMLLERLLCEKRREIDTRLTMLATRNTSGFRPASMLLYGTVPPRLLEQARAILENVSPGPKPDGFHDAGAIAAAANALVDRYRSVDHRFEARVEVRDDVFGLLVSNGRLMIASNSSVARKRLDALLAHEVSVHLLTYFNGATQGLTIFRTGLANYEGLQEGLGVFSEWAVGGLTPARLRLLAARVVAVDAMTDGAEFVDVFRMLRDLGFRAEGAFGIVARVFRSGGLAKDAIYLKGFLEVIDRVALGAPLTPFWLGKISSEHIAAVEELLQRGLLHEPAFEPEFLSRDDVKNRIHGLRGGISFDRFLNLE